MIEPNICAFVIDSEPESLERTINLLKSIPLILKIERAANSEEALLKIIESNPDVILLEYPIKGKASNELFRFIKTKLTTTTLIYVSESKKYAVKALRDGIFNYLLKPISKEELEKIISKVQLIKQSNVQDRINQIIEKASEEIKLKLHTNKGYLLINPDEILYCRANTYYTDLHLTDNRVELCFLLLAKLEKNLSQYNFLRVSRFHLINGKYVRKINRSNNTIILAFEGKEFEVKASKLQIKNLSKIDNE
jgi:two-component system LytT family response regulator